METQEFTETITSKCIKKKKGKKEMTERVFYLQANDITQKKIDKIIDNFICFFKKTIIEMNYFEIIIKCRVEDLQAIERIMNE